VGAQAVDEIIAHRFLGGVYIYRHPHSALFVGAHKRHSALFVGTHKRLFERAVLPRISAGFSCWGI